MKGMTKCLWLKADTHMYLKRFGFTKTYVQSHVYLQHYNEGKYNPKIALSCKGSASTESLKD